MRYLHLNCSQGYIADGAEATHDRDVSLCRRRFIYK